MIRVCSKVSTYVYDNLCPVCRLHFAVQAYKELLFYIQEMSLSKTEQENSKVMQSNVFYHPEYRDIFVTLLRNFYEVFQPTASLRDMVECTHVYVRMMERYCSENKHLVVRAKKRSKKKGKSKKKGTLCVLYSLSL